jgi:hypothetical protein
MCYHLPTSNFCADGKWIYRPIAMNYLPGWPAFIMRMVKPSKKFRLIWDIRALLSRACSPRHARKASSRFTCITRWSAISPWSNAYKLNLAFAKFTCYRVAAYPIPRCCAAWEGWQGGCWCKLSANILSSVSPGAPRSTRWPILFNPCTLPG